VTHPSLGKQLCTAFGRCERSDGRVYYGVKRDISIDPSRRALDASSRFSTAAPFVWGIVQFQPIIHDPLSEPTVETEAGRAGSFRRQIDIVTLAGPYNAVAKTQSLESHFFR
jgi:hypothetical protein